VSVTPSRSYYMLVASLPALPVRFDGGRVPISRATLRERLELLEPEDAEVTAQVAQYFSRSPESLDKTDEQVIARYHELMRTSRSDLVRHLIETRTVSRLLLSAFRRHRAGLAPPTWELRPADPLAEQIRKHWSTPNFGLRGSYRWLEDFAKHYDAGDMVGAQRVIFEERWNDWTKIAQRYTFTLEAVIAYLVRWEIVDRWTSQNAEAGKARFHNLVEETLGEYAKPV